jgi:pimeloyl-ACP methyl ester carboxylesterase
VSAVPAFVEQGQGDTTVLLLHGIGGGKAVWGDELGSGTLAALAGAGFRAVALDLPGYADSAAMGPPGMDAFTEGVAAVLDALGLPSAVLLGHSMGGMVAQAFAARWPQRVRGLVLACTSASFGAGSGDWQQRFVNERLASLDAGLGMAGMAQRLVPGMVGPAAPARALEGAMAVMSRVPEATYRAALRVVAAFDRREALPRITVPTLMLAAENDRTAPPAVMQRMAQRVAGAQYVCLPGAGHIANTEAPAAFNAAVLAFLQAHFAGAA